MLYYINVVLPYLWALSWPSPPCPQLGQQIQLHQGSGQPVNSYLVGMYRTLEEQEREDQRRLGELRRQME